MNLVFSLKEITLLVLLVTIARSKENITYLDFGGFSGNYLADNCSNPEKDLNVGDLFRTFSCKDHRVNCPYVDIKKVIPQNQSCCKNLTQIFECSYRHKMQLMRYLNLLKSWNCSDQLQTECSLKTFNFKF